MANMPTGTVTFLFTDLEASTRMWEEHKEAMEAALERHDAILRGAIDEHGGFVFSTAGDAFAAAFASHTAAVEAALAAQEQLAAEPWPEPVVLRARMGLHTGEAQERDDDYFGPALNRAARVMSAGHGGQVLVSDVTAGLLNRDDLRDLGEHRLKDLSGTERIWQVGSAEFPALRTLDASPGNLPLQSTSFIGRESHVADVVEALKEHRLVTLTGVGGVGKTRLALQAAGELASEYEGGAWVVELASVGEPEAVGHAIATVLGITPQADMSIEQSVVQALSGRQLLLVLDNCEHVIDVVADLADEVVQHCADVTLLATSREALSVGAEQIWPVPSLGFGEGADSPAVTLFAERASAVLPSFEVADDIEPVSEICRGLDGIPLAIELAAARVRSMSPAQIRDRLDERFRLLTGGARRALERHQTLRHAVQWSYDLLEPQEKVLLSRVSVFAGGFALGAAEAVCSGGEIDQLDIVDLLDSLVRKSLVTTERVDDEVRYGLLETIRQFGEEQLAARGEMEALRDGHARHYSDAAARNWELWLSPQQLLANQWFERELTNLRTAFRWSMETRDIERASRIAVDTGVIGYELLNYEPTLWALEAVEPVRQAHSARLPDLLGVASTIVLIGRLDEGQQLAREAIALLEGSEKETRWALPWFMLGLGMANQRHLEASIPILRDGAARPEDSALLYCKSTLAVWLGLDGQHSDAISLAGEAVDAASAGGIPAAIAFALEIQGGAFLYSGEHARAISTFENAVAVSRAAGLRAREIISNRDLAIALGRIGDLTAALPLFQRQLERGRSSGDWLVTRYTLGQLTLVFSRIGESKVVATLSSVVEDAMLSAADSGLYERAGQLARAALGEDEFSRFAAEGAAMPFVDLVRHAEGEIRRAIAELDSDD